MKVICERFDRCPSDIRGKHKCFHSYLHTHQPENCPHDECKREKVCVACVPVDKLEPHQQVIVCMVNL